jgi:hypothetical protein
MINGRPLTREGGPIITSIFYHPTALTFQKKFYSVLGPGVLWLAGWLAGSAGCICTVGS